MPQMSPLNWLMLFFIMSSIFLMFNILNYFSFSTNILKNEKLTSEKEYTKPQLWKW